MPKAQPLLVKPPETGQLTTKAKAGRVFKISLNGIPRVDAQTRARLEMAARNPESARRDYPQVVLD
jgi:hypothetical protein